MATFPNDLGGGNGGGGATAFDGLTDTPASKAGQAGKLTAVNVGETALEYIDPSTVGVMSSEDKAKLDGVEALAEVNNISGDDATDLTDGGETTLHTHPSSGGTTERLSTIMSADLILSGSEQQIPFDPAQTSRAEDITVNPSGSFTMANDGYYTGALTLFIDKPGGAGANMSIWVEVKPLSTGVWELSSSAMSNPIIHDDGGQPVALTSSVDALAGDEFRVMILLNAGTATLTTGSNTVALGTINNYAASLSVSKVGPVTP